MSAAPPVDRSEPATVRERMAPLEPPYPDDVAAHLARTMPSWSKEPPLRLFRTFARNFPMAQAMFGLGGFILARGTLDPADREILILRTCARCGAEYEWGVHAVSYPPRLGIDEKQVAATFAAGPDASVFTERQALLVRISDELHDTSTLCEASWNEAAAVFDEAQLLEILLVAGFYHFISYAVNATGVTRESWAARFPSVG